MRSIHVCSELPAGHPTRRRSEPETAARIVGLRRTVDFRNPIIHGCDAADDVILWRTVAHHLPGLLAGVEALLGP